MNPGTGLDPSWFEPLQKKAILKWNFVWGWGRIGKLFGIKDRRTARKYLSQYSKAIRVTGYGRGRRVVLNRWLWQQHYGEVLRGWPEICQRLGYKDFRTAKRRLEELGLLKYELKKPVVYCWKTA